MSIFPHFRMYRRNKHPAMIIGEATINKEKDGYMYRKTSHSEGLTKKGFFVITPNPNPKDDRPMFVEKRKRRDYKHKFGPKLPWNNPKNT